MRFEKAEIMKNGNKIKPAFLLSPVFVAYYSGCIVISLPVISFANQSHCIV